MSLKRNSEDIGWEYGVLVDPNDLNVIQCKLCPKVVKAGIYRLKLHIAQKRGHVTPCPNATPEDIARCKQAIEDSSKAKKARLMEQQGFTKPLDACSLGKKIQPKISEHIMKETLHKLKRYIARWMYMLEAARRYGPGANKPYQHELREKLLHEEKRRSIMNLCVNCSIGTSFLESKEASSESHIGELIFQYVNSCIEKVGAQNIVQVVTDNASNNMAAKDMLYVLKPNIFWTSCMRKMKKFKSIIGQAKALTIFIYAHHKTLFLMRKFTKKRDTLGRDQLRMMSQNKEWEKINQVKKTAKGVQATATLVRPSFWNGVSLCLRVFEPLVKVLRMILKTKKEIMVAIGNVDRSGTLYHSIIAIIDAKMKDKLDCPFHKAAYFLNPYYSYNDPSIFESEEVMDGFISAVETFYHAKWWGNYGTQVPTFQKMAIRILYLTSSASGCWIVEGDDEEGSDIEHVIALTWKLIAETCGAEEVNKLRRSARLNQTRDIEDDVHDEPEEEEQMDEEEIEFESDQENVVTIGYGEEEVEDDD
ncbi:hypothetical protein PVAP13_8KG161605 [Panicum virgatum]|uniref:DUF659 domain-containing protein n=1 Tax=Panicum virgatum TaxID=38727 RepID=A0A8T0PTV1_PANVG|nr:hypothetical protein PVAP13_8KG161605 [Panicum virgatum]